MIASILPLEILENIFGNLNGVDIFQCSKVCRRWEQAVDGLSDAFWRELCAQEHHEVYAEAYRRAQLSWRELYRSLGRWADVAAARVTVHRTPATKTDNYQQLENCIISYCLSVNPSTKENPYDTITYYDLASQKEQHRESFSPFDKYSESDNILVIDSNTDSYLADRLVRVISKANRNSYVELTVDRFRPWLLYKDEVFYERSFEDYGEFWHVKLMQNDSNITLVDEKLAHEEIGGDLEDVVYVGDQLNIFKTYDGYMTIQKLVDKHLNFVCDIEAIDENVVDPLEVIKESGFVWSTPKIFFWLSHCYNHDERFTKYNVGSACTYGKIVIVGTCSSPTIHIFYNPFGPNGKLELHKATPLKSISLEEYKVEDTALDSYKQGYNEYNYINKINVVETLNGHKILFLYYRSILVIELSHSVSDKRCMSPVPVASVSPKSIKLRK